MRTFVQLAAVVSKDNGQFQRVLNQLGLGFDDSDPARNDVFASCEVTVPADEPTYAISLNGVTAASFLLIVAYDDISVSLDGGPPIPVLTTPAQQTNLSVLQQAEQPGFVLWRGNISSIVLTNTSLTDQARVFIAAVGNNS